LRKPISGLFLNLAQTCANLRQPSTLRKLIRMSLAVYFWKQLIGMSVEAFAAAGRRCGTSRNQSGRVGCSIDGFGCPGQLVLEANYAPAM
jgi:hypothetical protein